jgi:hypothetical protein
VAQEWLLSAVDQRTFAAQQARVVDDLNRPDLINVVPQYLQDAMRFWQRHTFFFNDTDNSLVPPYVNGLFYTQGATIQVNVGGTIYAFVAGNSGLAQATGQPAWTANPFTPPNQNNPPTNAFPPPPNGTYGTTLDNGGPPTGIIWLNNGAYQQGSTTSLSTLYFVNQYQMPIDLIKLNLVEATWQGNLRIVIPDVPYAQIRLWDVIRPFPPATYPSWSAWYQQQLYFWPYPSGLYPITLSYRSAPPVVTAPNGFNIWTTQAEAMIRYYAEGLIQKNLIHDKQASDDCFALSQAEFLQIQSQQISQDDRAGSPPSDW